MPCFDICTSKSGPRILCVLYILACKCASGCSGVQIFESWTWHVATAACQNVLLFDISVQFFFKKPLHLATLLTFRVCWSSFCWLSRNGIFFLPTRLVFSAFHLQTQLLCSAFQLSILLEVWLLNCLRTSKCRSNPNSETNRDWETFAHAIHAMIKWIKWSSIWALPHQNRMWTHRTESWLASPTIPPLFPCSPPHPCSKPHHTSPRSLFPVWRSFLTPCPYCSGEVVSNNYSLEVLGPPFFTGELLYLWDVGLHCWAESNGKAACLSPNFGFGTSLNLMSPAKGGHIFQAWPRGYRCKSSEWLQHDSQSSHNFVLATEKTKWFRVSRTTILIYIFMKKMPVGWVIQGIILPIFLSWAMKKDHWLFRLYRGWKYDAVI